ncbi:two-component regulator propeller domain-containing protein [Flammeovirgaceae bacterium SG7u.111]|nr:two-component regulator propeller domain-containing protein [Flammeovirgaceae bacterium SG7u.132]WPO34236.1 two-component regulator propeller domain-containing protein [Flammeovirgaceae bacterium SG7u.111]
MRKTLLLFFLLIALGASAQNIKFRHITTDDGLSNSWVLSILRDNQGYLWIGTMEGLNLYDGYSIKVFKNDGINGLHNNSILCLLEDNNGGIWMGTYHGFYKFDRDTETFTAFHTDENDPKSISSDRVFSIAEESDSTLWIATENGLNRFNINSLAFESYVHDENNPNSLIKNNIKKLKTDSKGNLWIGSEIGISLLKKGSAKFENYSHDPNNSNSIIGNTIKDFAEDKDGNIWIGTTDGLCKYDPVTDTFSSLLADPSRPSQALNNNNIISLASDQDNLYIGTSSGYHYMDLKTGTFHYFSTSITNEHSLLSPSIHTLFYDQINQMVWLGTYNGGINYYSKIDKSITHHKASPTGLNNGKIHSILETEAGKILLGTDGGGINTFDPKTETFKYYSSANKPGLLKENAVMILFEDKQNRIWIHTYMQGINVISPDWNTSILYSHDPSNPNSLPSNEVVQIQEDNKNIISVLSGEKIVVFDPKKNHFIGFEEAYGIKLPENIHFFHINKNNKAWVIYAVEEGRSYNFLSADLNSKEVTVYDEQIKPYLAQMGQIIDVVKEGKDGDVWVSTYESGLCYINKEKGINISYFTDNGLPSNNIMAMEEDDEGNLWVSTDNGLVKFIDGINSPTEPNFRTYSVDDGIQSKEFKKRVSHRGRNGKLYFGGNNGFNILDPSKIQDNLFLPPIVFTDLKIFNTPVGLNQENSPLTKSISRTKEITFTHDQSVFTLEFAALNLDLPEKNQYAYKLDGLEKDWNYVGNQRSATYTNLDPGEYEFIVKASNNDAIWNELPAILKITILPPWWETWWFRTIAAILFLGSGILFFIVRTKHLKQRQVELEKQVSVRTQELKGANDNLQKQQEEIKAQNEELHQMAEELQVQRDYLEDTNIIVGKKNEALADMNKALTDSITYARRIQEAILPSAEEMKEDLKDFFLIFKPKDIVSGDFYWYSKQGDSVFLAVVDCTGHGVPGAYMSMLGNSFLNRIVNEMKETEPSRILACMDQFVVDALKQKEGQNRDGMDLGVCRIEKLSNGNTKVTYAGAKTPLLYCKKEAESICREQGDRSSIGGIKISGKSFSDLEIELEPGDCFYLTTDGFIDQNDPNRRRFGTKRFMNAIFNQFGKPMELQQISLETLLQAHQEEEQQRDDITVIGVQI